MSVQLTRRQALLGAGGLAAGAAIGGGVVGMRDAGGALWNAFDGEHQAGILTPRQSHLALVALDLETPDAGDLRSLMATWTGLIRSLTSATLARRIDGPVDDPPADSGEAYGLGARALSVTVGIGPGVFDNRYGLAGRAPAALRPLPALPGEGRLQGRRSDGDLLLQICGEDRQVVFHAIHALTNAALGIATVRWTQHGFVSAPPGATARNLLGFADGTVNIARDERAALARHVWVAPGAGGHRDWMVGGTYLVYRRIRLRLVAWDRASLGEQERTIGRRKATGARLAGTPGSHARAARVDGIRLLRRAYNYDDGAAPDGSLDAGLAFVCFTSDPARFAVVQRSLARVDALQRYLEHTAGALFAICPAPRAGGYLAEPLWGDGARPTRRNHAGVHT